MWPDAWLARYHLTSSGLEDDESNWLRAIFRKHRKSFSYLEHIVVHQALLNNSWQICDILDELNQYPVDKGSLQVPVDTTGSHHLTLDQENWLQLLSSHSPKHARKLSPALYARLYRNHRDWLLEINLQNADERSHQKTNRVDWGKRDREYLQVLRELANFMAANSHGPRRSRAFYLKMLGRESTVEKNLHRMPLSTAFLAGHVESVAQFQVRRLKNTFDELRNEFNSPPRWRLLRESKLSEERLTEYAKRHLEEMEQKADEIQRHRG